MDTIKEVSGSKIEPPQDFSFPFKPYDIQNQFMKALFKALVDESLGIFESPTGTGKSLSMLCGALTWLEAHEAQRLKDLKAFISSINLEKEEQEAKESTDWIKSLHEVRKKKDSLCKAKRELLFLEQMIEKREKILQSRHKILKSKNSTFFRPSSSNHNSSSNSNKSESNRNEDIKEKDENELFDDILFDDFALNDYSDSDASEDDEHEEPEFHAPKIIFASRTHTQISQFTKELKRTSFENRVTAVTLGSRQNLCVNPEVTRLKNLSLMNEKCLDLQKGSKGRKTDKTDGKKLKTCQGCSYYKSTAIESLKNHILAEPMDIEELVNVAKTEHKACPYYASRKASKEAQLILLPYNTILHSGTRDGVGIQIENSVLLLDEAHNIIESISNMYSNLITLAQLKDCYTALETYIKRYMTRFSTNNLLNLKQIRFILKALIKFLEQGDKIDNNDTSNNTDEISTLKTKSLFTIQEFKNEIDIGQYDLYNLLKFCKKSHLIFKLKGYMIQQQKLALVNSLATGNMDKPPSPTKLNTKSSGKGKITTKKNKKDEKEKELIPLESEEEKDNNNHSTEKTKVNSQAILNFSEFLKSLKTCDAEGRIIIDRKQKSYKFLLLNAAPQFQFLVKSMRSIILAGGTMKPYDEIMDQLFRGSLKPISNFSCSHVIPDDNLVCLALTRGPKNTIFDFTYKNRNSPELMQELTQTISNVVRMVPGGVVCFLPSYEYEGIFYTYLQESGAFLMINSKKRIFREPKDGNCDMVLNEYSRQIRNNTNGALLFAVVGGKLSEGINFSDDLGRCVIVVGLPFPNITSVEIQEKVQYATSCFGKEKGDALLTTMCSKAVNQSVGRAIRHANDYAAILLIDQRFARPNQQALLPDWIQKRSSVCQNFGQGIAALGKFFSNKRKLNESLAPAASP